MEIPHGRATLAVRPWPCGKPKIELIGMQRFDSHGQLGEPHGRVACPCESGNLGFSANFEPQVGESDFWEQKQSPRERKYEEHILEAILELGFIESSLEIVLGVEIIIPEQIFLILMSMTTPITVFFSLSME
ncbi:unnamed protein product [Linum trigynum]|uniref:Uncharacterized protein n=1 Tax=Linum trigynum TaxID=586398 RepID=A0AAV2F4U9_9ROSI